MKYLITILIFFIVRIIIIKTFENIRAYQLKDESIEKIEAITEYEKASGSWFY